MATTLTKSRKFKLTVASVFAAGVFAALNGSLFAWDPNQTNSVGGRTWLAESAGGGYSTNGGGNYPTPPGDQVIRDDIEERIFHYRVDRTGSTSAANVIMLINMDMNTSAADVI